VNMSQIQTEHLEFGKPCCGSVRECSVKFHAVISLTKKAVLRRINAVRCYRNPNYESGKYKFYPSNDVALIEHYRSNRGVVYLYVLWKPEGLSDRDVLRIALEALGYTDYEVIQCKDDIHECIFH